MCHAAGIKKSWEKFPIKTSKSLKNNKSWSQSTHIILLQTGGRKKLLLSSIHSVMLSGSPSWGLDFLDKACSPFSSPILFDISTKKSGVWKILKKQTVIRKLGNNNVCWMWNSSEGSSEGFWVNLVPRVFLVPCLRPRPQERGKDLVTLYPGNEVGHVSSRFYLTSTRKLTLFFLLKMDVLITQNGNNLYSHLRKKFWSLLIIIII